MTKNHLNWKPGGAQGAEMPEFKPDEEILVMGCAHSGVEVWACCSRGDLFRTIPGGWGRRWVSILHYIPVSEIPTPSKGA